MARPEKKGGTRKPKDHRVSYERTLGDRVTGPSHDCPPMIPRSQPPRSPHLARLGAVGAEPPKETPEAGPRWSRSVTRKGPAPKLCAGDDQDPGGVFGGLGSADSELSQVGPLPVPTSPFSFF